MSDSKKLYASLSAIHSALDDALGDSDVTHIDDDDELRSEHPTQWAAQKLAEVIAALHSDAVADGAETTSDRIKELESALMVFFQVLRGESSFVQNAYELHVSKADYGKARDIYDRRSAPVKAVGSEALREAEERDAFIEAHHKFFDLTETSDAWGRPIFMHTHIQAMWDGWKRRAALAHPGSGDAEPGAK